MRSIAAQEAISAELAASRTGSGQLASTPARLLSLSASRMFVAIKSDLEANGHQDALPSPHRYRESTQSLARDLYLPLRSTPPVNDDSPATPLPNEPIATTCSF
ncbi:hypothetical protein CGZ80_17685 [Rhodopirellula sp. MGV]|nr:hypothetical protein CGZ80_17685 [Rhodopirellula sp. MGV]PNY34464.1 hypothetical protein C2E31_23220 [Rhodopirellula baltica]